MGKEGINIFLRFCFCHPLGNNLACCCRSVSHVEKHSISSWLTGPSINQPTLGISIPCLLGHGSPVTMVISAYNWTCTSNQSPAHQQAQNHLPSLTHRPRTPLGRHCETVSRSVSQLPSSIAPRIGAFPPGRSHPNQFLHRRCRLMASSTVLGIPPSLSNRGRAMCIATWTWQRKALETSAVQVAA